MLFAQKWREMLEQTPNLDFYQDMVKGLVVKEGRCFGVVTGMGHEILSDAVVLTNGTFLNGVVHIGEKNFGGGRMAERAASGITEQLVELGFESDRLKTGTPPRIDGRSLDYSKMEEQPGDDQVVGFSFQDVPKPAEQRSCWIAYTDPTVHDVLKTGFDRSPMFAGRIDGVGPRYCPSIEDKINRFSDRDRHQLFIEPEGWNTVEIYVNGFSTSLPEDVQYEALRRVPGFENVRMFRPGYAIEYDYFPPTQLDYSLETKKLRNLFFAGQINGTTGYEEAACQGLMAGINAHRRSKEVDTLILKRSDAYIGVLIDDLISKGTKEPYRMFTSRAEYRTLLRQDNADLRLTEMSYRIGLAGQDRMDRVEKKSSSISNIKYFLNTISIEPDEVNGWLLSLGSAPISEKQKASRIVLRPDVELSAFMEACPKLKGGLQQYNVESLEQAGIQIKYQVYLDKERELVSRMAQMEELEIPERFDYARIGSLGNEAREKLEKVRPRTLGQASRISGINPSDVQILMVYMGR
jgi:tRNA uridine 5-carboxymethylaminomethyl modification enzyme